MALRLEHFTPAENPDLFYRRVGSPAIEDFLKKGQIAGTAKYGTEAYFLRGGEWSTSGAPYRITMDTAKLNPIENGLYGDLNFNKYLTKQGAFPVGGMTGGNYPRLTPNPNASFIDRVNPLNRFGIKIEDTRTKEAIYDRTNPIQKTPIKTTLKNAGVEAGIFMSQPEVASAISKAGTVAKTGVGLAGLAGYTASFLEDAPKTVLAYGVPFTPFKIGVGTVSDLGKGSDLESRGQWVFSDTGEPRFVRYE